MALHLRPDIEAARRKMQNRFGAGRELRTLESHLDEGEQIQLLCVGQHARHYGLVSLTDRRLLFIMDDLSAQVCRDFPRDTIVGVRWASRVTVGTLVVTCGADDVFFKNMNKRDGQRIADALAENVAPARLPLMRAAGPSSASSVPSSTADVYESLRKLGELRDAGVVSAGEFEEKKRELLARI